MQPIISVKGISKRYTINHHRGSYIALRDVIASIAKKPLSYVRQKAKAMIGVDTKEEFWALKNINFTVNRGDVLGVIGKNGAGKSTLLKILTQITPPSSGEIRMEGKVASLLEVGTGFHPELTGRENIFLNAAILGMTRRETAKKFDEIVEFSGIEKFLDTPVKYYSSGMYVRLAFSVAAHLEPDILLVDEVLAVGDAEFQRKCLGKMEEVTQQNGRTILFVSHNMAAIERICNRVIVIEKGEIKLDTTDVSGAVKSYLQTSEGATQGYKWTSEKDPVPTNEYYNPTEMYLEQENGTLCDAPVRNDETVSVVIKGNILNYDPLMTVGYSIFTSEGSLLYWSVQTDQEESLWPKLTNGPFTLKARIPQHLLNEGSYRIEMIGGLNDRLWLFAPGSNVPTINFSIKGGLSNSPYWTTKRPGILAPVLDWKLADEPGQKSHESR